MGKLTAVAVAVLAALLPTTRAAAKDGVAPPASIASDIADAALTAERVRLMAELRPGADPHAVARGLGGRVDRSVPGLAEIDLPADRLEAFARSGAATVIRAPHTPVADSIQGEGLLEIKAPHWQGHGHSGKGERIAVIDRGFAFWADAQRAGDLPAAAAAADYCNDPYPDPHGTEIAEVVHEVAPDAQLLTACVKDELGLTQATQWALDNGADVIVHAMSWFNTSRGDGSGGPGSPDAAVAMAEAAGVVWVNSAGNEAKTHWTATMADADNDGLVEFAAGDETMRTRLSQGACVYLKWDAWPTTSRDLDLELIDLRYNTVMASSTTRQSATPGPPVERVCNPDSSAGYVDVRIRDTQPADPWLPRLDLFNNHHFFEWEDQDVAFEYDVASGSVTEPASSPKALAVGAYCVATGVAEPTSGMGPNIAGTPKPDLMGPAGVQARLNNSSGDTPCGGGFNGTSAGAAHAAGAALLVRDAHPSLSPAAVRSFLKTRTEGGHLRLRSFTDVGGEHAFFGPAEALAHAGIASGTAFAPDLTLTRADAAGWVLRAMGHAGHLPAYQGYFDDVPASAPYAGLVEHLYEHGVVERGPDRLFRPNDGLLRRDAAVWLLRAIGHAGHFAPHQGLFDDVPSSAVYAGAVEHLHDHGAVDVPADRLFRPNDGATRGEAAQFLAAAFDLRWYQYVPFDGAYDPVIDHESRWLHVTNTATGVLASVNVKTGTIAPPVSLGDTGSWAADVSHDSRLVYVSDTRGHRLAVVDVATRQTVGYVPVPSIYSDYQLYPRSVVMTANGDLLVATSGWPNITAGQLWSIDPATGQATSREAELEALPLSPGTNDNVELERSYDGNRAIVLIGDSSWGYVVLYDAATDTLVGGMTTGMFNIRTAMDRAGALTQIDRISFDGAWRKRGEMGPPVTGWAIRWDGRLAYHVENGRVVVDDMATLAPVGALPLGLPMGRAHDLGAINGGAGRMALSPDGLTVAVVTEDGFAIVPTRAAKVDPAGPHAPDPPTNVKATVGNGSATVSWTPPAKTGGAVTAYRVSSWPEWKTTTVPGTATSAVVTGLTNGKQYRFIVEAQNASGWGPQSVPSLSVVPAEAAEPPPPGSGYWMLGSGGQVHAFGDAVAAGWHATPVPAVDIEATSSGKGYWVADAAGHVFAYGDAPYLGNAPADVAGSGDAVTTVAGTPSGQGYWLFTKRGRALRFGDAVLKGDMSATALNGHIVDSAATPSGQGYYMVGSDGGIFAFGDAVFRGSMGGTPLNQPVNGLVPDGDGTGYWLVASDGGVFAFEAGFRGSLGSLRLNAPIAAMSRYGDGYLLVGRDGGIFNFSNEAFRGSLGSNPPPYPIVSAAGLP